MMTPLLTHRPEASSLGGARSGGLFQLRLVDADSRLTARVSGPLDVEHTPEFVERIRPFCGPRRQVIVDLRRALYIDSAGVRALLSLKSDLEEDGGRLRLVIEPGSRVERALRLLRLEEHFGTLPEGRAPAEVPLLRAA